MFHPRIGGSAAARLGTRALAVVLATGTIGSLAAPVTAQAASPQLVISQVYGGGASNGATWRNDYVEIFNRGDTPEDLTSFSLQYASAAGSSWQVSALPSGVVVPAGGHVLLAQAAGTSGAELLGFDGRGTLSLNATTGKIALVKSPARLTSGCPLGDPSLVDFVGYGPAANCHEGSAPAPSPGIRDAIARVGEGCTDSDDNAADFAVAAAEPKFAWSPPSLCTAPTPDPPPANPAPTLTPIGDRAVEEGQTLTFTVAGVDPDGDALTFTASGLPPGATFDPDTQTFTWTPDAGQAGDYAGVAFEVTDGKDTASESITITVTAPAA